MIEPSLKEYCQQLPPDHRVNRELAALKHFITKVADVKKDYEGDRDSIGLEAEVMLLDNRASMSHAIDIINGETHC